MAGTSRYVAALAVLHNGGQISCHGFLGRAALLATSQLAFEVPKQSVRVPLAMNV